LQQLSKKSSPYYILCNVYYLLEVKFTTLDEIEDNQGIRDNCGLLPGLRISAGADAYRGTVRKGIQLSRRRAL